MFPFPTRRVFHSKAVHRQPCVLGVLFSFLFCSLVFFFFSIGIAFSQDVPDVEDIFQSIRTPQQKESPPLPPQEQTPKQDQTVRPPPSFLKRLGENLSENLTWGGYFRNENAYRIVEPIGFDKITNILSLEGRYRLGPKMNLAGRIRGFYNAVYDLQSIDRVDPRKGPDTILVDQLTPDQVAALQSDNVQEVEIVKSRIELKELYLDLKLKNLDLRIGRQIVRWGVVEGARVTDEINPLDFYELILREINDRYIPLFMIRADLYVGSSTIEAIVIPEVRGHRPAPRGTKWEQFRFLPNLQKPEQPWEDFPKNIGNSEIALKYTRLFSGFEVSGSYFRTWDDFPSSYRSIAGLGIFGLSPTIDFTPKYQRLNIFGTTFSKAFSGFILNAEAAYVDGKVFGAKFGDRITTTQGEVQKNFVKYAVGLDFSIWGVDLSPALIQQYILDYDDQIIQKRLDTVGALFARKHFIHNLWLGDLLLIYFANDKDWLIRPRTVYNLTDRIRLAFGVDFFEGKIGTGLPGEFHFIGFFDNNDRVFWDITYSF